MSFIGIITNPKNEMYMKKMLSKKFSVQNIIFISDKNIRNVRNITFDILVIDTVVQEIFMLKEIVLKAKYIILNSDLKKNLNVFENLNLTILTYGFHNKATFSVSSVSEENIIICLQRIIKNMGGQRYEPQEFEIPNVKNIDIYAIISVHILLLIY